LSVAGVGVGADTALATVLGARQPPEEKRLLVVGMNRPRAAALGMTARRAAVHAARDRESKRSRCPPHCPR
jgi:hypothetical protein